MSMAPALTRHPLSYWALVTLTILLGTVTAGPARAQTPGFTEIYNSGVLTLGPDQSLQLTIVNNNNVPDPALPDASAAVESCTVVAQFLDGNGNTLQKQQQQTLQPGQNLSLSQGGQSTIQARVDVSPGTASGFARAIADQCVVSDEILKTSSTDPVLFAPLAKTHAQEGKKECISDCLKFCGEHRQIPTFLCLTTCKPNC